jgi:hypothetical protein
MLQSLYRPRFTRRLYYCWLLRKARRNGPEAYREVRWLIARNIVLHRRTRR